MNNMHITFTKASNKSDVKESGEINILYHQIRGEAKIHTHTHTYTHIHTHTRTHTHIMIDTRALLDFRPIITYET